MGATSAKEKIGERVMTIASEEDLRHSEDERIELVPTSPSSSTTESDTQTKRRPTTVANRLGFSGASVTRSEAKNPKGKFDEIMQGGLKSHGVESRRSLHKRRREEDDWNKDSDVSFISNDADRFSRGSPINSVRRTDNSRFAKANKTYGRHNNYASDSRFGGDSLSRTPYKNEGGHRVDCLRYPGASLTNSMRTKDEKQQSATPLKRAGILQGYLSSSMRRDSSQQRSVLESLENDSPKPKPPKTSLFENCWPAVKRMSPLSILTSGLGRKRDVHALSDARCHDEFRGLLERHGERIAEKRRLVSPVYKERPPRADQKSPSTSARKSKRSGAIVDLISSSEDEEELLSFEAGRETAPKRRLSDTNRVQSNHQTARGPFPCVRVAVGTHTREGGKVLFATAAMKITLQQHEAHLDESVVIAADDLHSIGIYTEKDDTFIAIKTSPSWVDARWSHYYDPQHTETQHCYIIVMVNKQDMSQIETNLQLVSSKANKTPLFESINDANKDEVLATFKLRKTRRRRTESEAAVNADEAVLTYPYDSETNDLITITRGDLERLTPGEYLNDNLVDFYLRYLQLDEISPEKRERIHIFNSFFYTRLTAGGRTHSELSTMNGFKNVERWTRKIDIFSKDFILVPINESLHWSLAIICHPGAVMNQTRLRRTCIVIFDSLKCHSVSKIKKYIESYLRLEWTSKKGNEPGYSEESLPIVIPKVPTQDNGCDCGVFLLKYADVFLRRVKYVSSNDAQNNLSSYLNPTMFTKADIGYLRSNISTLIKTMVESRKLKPDFEKDQDEEVPADH